MKSVINGETTLFVGGHYEILNPGSGQAVTKYYFAGASRIAMRKTIVPQSDTLTYLLGDHLGSTSLAIDADTDEVIETRYKPWGEVRFTTEDLTEPIEEITLPTRYTFTGQYSDSYIKLLWYSSRHYDPELGRFIQPDSIVPDPNNPQAWDRYSYVSNSPVRYTDPTGHKECDYDCQVEYQNADPEFEDYCYWCEWDVAEQEKNEEIAETILFDGTELLVSILFEPADWALTIGNCLNGDCSLLALALMVTPGLNGKMEDIITIGGKTVGHHTIPRQILDKLLPSDIASVVRGKRGAPNIWQIPVGLHKVIHSGPGPGGYYNAVWRTAIERLQASGNLTPQAILAVREQLANAFGFGR